MLLATNLTERIIGLAIEAQLQTYLRTSSIRIGLILNFNASRLIDGLRRFGV